MNEEVAEANENAALLSALLDLEHQCETHAALIEADELLAGAEVA